MLKLARSGVALLLGLVLAITLFTSGAFAQQVNAQHGSPSFSAESIVTTTVFTGVNQTAHSTTGQQVTQPLSANWRWHRTNYRWGGWGGGWDGGYWGGSYWDDCGCW
ncbi:MAG TPA: hypothetical protein VGD98_10585 [Ktedonobacteraceae bacterium]